MFDPELFENGSLILRGKNVIPQGIYRDCPVCCIGPYCRDGDMELFRIEIPGESYFECGYTFADSESCSFRYPGQWAEDDPRIEALAKICRKFLTGLRANADKEAVAIV